MAINIKTWHDEALNAAIDITLLQPYMTKIIVGVLLSSLRQAGYVLVICTVLGPGHPCALADAACLPIVAA